MALWDHWMPTKKNMIVSCCLRIHDSMCISWAMLQTVESNSTLGLIFVEFRILKFIVKNMSSSHIQSQVCERSSWIDFSFWCWLFSVATPIRSSWVFSRPAPVSQKLVGTGCRRLQLACLWSWKRYGRVEFHYDTYHPSPWTRTMICILQEASMQLILWSVHIMTTSHSAMFGSFWQHRVKHLLIIRLHHFFYVMIGSKSKQNLNRVFPFFRI